MQPDLAGYGGGRRPVREDRAALRRPRRDGAGRAMRGEGAVVLDYAVHAEGIADAHRVAPLAGGVARIRDAPADRVGLAADRDRARRRGRRWRVPADHTAADLFTGRVRAPYDLGVAGRRVDGDVEAAQVGPRDVGAEPGYGGDLERDQAVVARLQHRQPVRRPEVEDIAADVSRDGPRAAVGAGRITQPAEHAHVRTGRGSEPGGTVREARDDANVREPIASEPSVVDVPGVYERTVPHASTPPMIRQGIGPGASCGDGRGVGVGVGAGHARPAPWAQTSAIVRRLSTSSTRSAELPVEISA